MFSVSEPKQPKPNENILASFPVTEGDALMVPLRLGDRQYELLLDTGSSETIFDTSLRSHLGKPVDARTATTGTSFIDTDLYALPNAQIGEWRLPADRPVACMDLTRMRQVVGRDLHGILGLAHLKDLILQVDFDQGLGLLQRRLVPEEVRGYEGMSFVYDSQGCMRIVAKVGEAESQSFIVDTGCSHTGILMQPLFTRLVESRQLRITGKRTYTTVSDHGSSPTGRLSDLVVGSFIHQNLCFCSGDENTLGVGYLRRYRMVIDFPQRKIYLAKGKQFANLDREDLSGLHLLLKGET